MLKHIKKDLWKILCVIWAMAVALFWFSMRVIWSGISKVLYEAMGKKEPTEFLLNFPLYISILLWVLLAFAVVTLVRKGGKKRIAITLTVLLGFFTVASAVVVVMGAIDYLYFILPKFFLSFSVGMCIAAFAALLFYPPVKNCKGCTALKWVLVALVILVAVLKGYGVTLGSRFTYEPVVYTVEQAVAVLKSMRGGQNHA